MNEFHFPGRPELSLRAADFTKKADDVQVLLPTNP